MNTILHLGRHDLRSQRLLLLAVGAIVILETISALNPGISRNAWATLIGARFGLIALATGLIVQRDPLVGTAAFWRTRPISRATLLASKCLSLVLVLVAVPAIVIGVAWYAMGVYAGDAVRLASLVAVDCAAVVLVAAMAAVVTPNLTYAAVAGVAGGTMLMVLYAVIIPTMTLWWPRLGNALHAFHLPVFLAVLFALGVPAVVWQFLRLKDWQSAALVAVALVAAELLAVFGPTPQLSPSGPLPAGVLDPQSVRVTIVEDSIRRDASLASGAAAQPVRYTGDVTADGHPPAVKVYVTAIDTRLLLRDRTFRWHGSTPWVLPRRPSIADSSSATETALAAAVAPARIVGRRPRIAEHAARVDLLAISGADERQAATGRGLLTTDVTFTARRAAIAASAPLKTGARLRRAGVAATVMSATHADGWVICRLRVSAVASAGARGMFLLLNRSRRQAVYPSRQELLGWGRAAWMGGPTEVRDMVFTSDPPDRADALRLDADWLAGAELVEVVDEPLGTFTRQVQVPVIIGVGGKTGVRD